MDKKELYISKEEIKESMKKVEMSNIAISLSKDDNPANHFIHLLYNGDGFIRSLFKK